MREGLKNIYDVSKNNIRGLYFQTV